MLRRTTALLNIASLVLVSLLPLISTASAQAKGAKAGKKSFALTIARDPKVSPDLAETTTNVRGSSSSNATVRVIIETKGQPTLDQDNAIADAGGVKLQGFANL